jgi:DNA-binding NarL/FixJ family response regulator
MSRRMLLNLPQLTRREKLIIAAVLEATGAASRQIDEPAVPPPPAPRLPVLAEPPVEMGSRDRFKGPPYYLTPREFEVLDGMARGLKNKQIGIELGISDRTVETHRKRVLAKLGVSSLGEFMLKVWAPAALAEPMRRGRDN